MKLLPLILLFSLSLNLFAKEIHIARFEYKNEIQYGQINNDYIQALDSNIYENIKPVGEKIALKEVKLLLPSKAQNVFAVGMNFASHLSSPSDLPPPLFFKSPSSLILSGETIVLPKDSTNVHFEGELVLIIGKEAKNITIKEAPSYIFGVTVGNDLTERNWQSSDLQWMRAKATDGFGPISSIITIGVDYNNLLLTTKLNGKIVQQENTKHMIHKPSKVVSYLSKYFTLMPGDLIYMGTPGRTQNLSDADIVSVEIEKIGKVINKISTNNN
jgi:2-keto-4-pentenoate hydratase/2-oxohepta-3-ene-1,7-dioic acid hydratase in catechol pathway